MKLGIVLSLLLFIALTASAQNNRSFVSTSGNDANNCTPGSECRSFTRAMTVTNPGGEIVAISSGGYGPFTITKAMTVVSAPGAYAAITTAADGIDVAAGASDRVVLHGLNINMTNPSIGVGIAGTSYGSLYIEGCSVTGGYTGIELAPGSLSPAMVSDSVVRATSAIGYSVQGQTTLVRCRAENGDVGLWVQPGSGADGVVSAVDFVAVANFFGAYATGDTAGHTMEMNLDRALVSNNSGIGIIGSAFSGAVVNVRLSNSTVTNNGTYGIQQYGTAYFGSRNNNLVGGNTTADTNGTITTMTVH